MIEVKIEKMYSDVIVPEYSHEDDSGMDIRAYFSDEWVAKNHFTLPDLSDPYSYKNEFNDYRWCEVNCQTRTIIPTGIKVAIPNGYEIQVRPRSGLAFKQGLTVLNSPGTIDAGYRGELGVIIFNSSKSEMARIKHGDRIAQIVLQQVPKISWTLVESVDKTDRGEGGFGSTGKS